MSVTPAPITESRPPTPPESPRPTSIWRRVLWVVALLLFLAAGFLLLRSHANRFPPPLAGDVWEHWLIAESVDRHGTLDLQPGDTDYTYSQTASFGYPPPPKDPHAYAKAPDGRLYGVHFWGYAVCGVPAKNFLRETDRNQLAWPGLSNAMWFLFALGVVIFGSSAPVGERFALAGLAAAGPAWVYIGWPGPELYSWAFAFIAIAAYRDRRYVLSGIGVGLAALQNPPIILFGAVPVLAALIERRWWRAVGSAAGGALGLLPYAFFYYHFGKPNLIAEDYARVAYISWVRTWSQLADFNQGLFPFAPLLVVGMLVGAGRIVYLRDWRGLLLIAGTVAVAVGTQVSRNWNSGCDLIQRYLVWLIPLLAGVAVTGIGGRWRLWTFALVAVIVHAGLVSVYRYTDPAPRGCLGHGPLARWVLNKYPEAYWVEPEIFMERTRQADDWPMTPSELPVGYVRPDGTVSKMLVDPDNIDAVAKGYEVEPSYLAALRADAVGRPGPFFANPPPGAVRARSSP